MKSNQIQWNLMKSNEIKWNLMTFNQIQGKLMKFNKILWNLMKSNEFQWNLKSSELRISHRLVLQVNKYVEYIWFQWFSYSSHVFSLVVAGLHKYSPKWTVYVKSMRFPQLSYDYDAFSTFSTWFLQKSFRSHLVVVWPSFPGVEQRSQNTYRNNDYTHFWL